MPKITRHLSRNVIDIVNECKAFLSGDEELIYALPLYKDEFYATITIKPYMKYMIVRDPLVLTSQMVYGFIQASRSKRLYTKQWIRIHFVAERY
jgi:hypothetical protein